tara:strand:+ start:59 stop:496 length:438 start_codon:yes stop_codon:yes gene_type:complete
MPFTGNAMNMTSMLGNAVGNIAGGIKSGYNSLFGGGDPAGQPAAQPAGVPGLTSGMDLSGTDPAALKQIQGKLGVTQDGILGPQTQEAYNTWSQGQESSNTGNTTTQSVDSGANNAVAEAKKQKNKGMVSDAFNNMSFGHSENFK